MSFIDKVREDRLPLATVLKKHPGIRRFIEELYPDRAHFIFELLQNAEDVGATEGRFALGQNSASFEHNGHPFTEENVWGITDIGGDNKEEDEDKIGRFGVGFKAVFAYCETPYIWSPTFSFMISDFVLPTELETKSDVGEKTYFEFPFNNTKKSAQIPYEEIKTGLEELAETTLLFLSSLKSIHWQIDQQSAGEIVRINHSEHHIEVQKRMGGKTVSSSHFLRFSNALDCLDLDKHCVSIAFELDFLPSVTVFDAEKPLDKQLKIVPANEGRVAIYFPAKNENSGLRFHLHAPFVPVPDRASIKETDLNKPLFEQLARLAASSLHTVRNQGLLTRDFLEVLPNSRDKIKKDYAMIRDAIITEMNNEPLTPTQSKNHEPAKYLLQAKASLKKLLSEEDLDFLLNYEEVPFKWAIGAHQKNSHVDIFLTDLAIAPWDIEAFVKMLKENTSETSCVPSNSSKHKNITDVKLMDWLANKSDVWHQELYALLYRDYINSGSEYLKTCTLKELKIVRLSNGVHHIGPGCYFPSDDTVHDESRPYVAKGVYSYGKNKQQQQDAKDLLLKADVVEFNETEQIKEILNKRYRPKSFNPGINDIKQFIAFLDKNPPQKTLFNGYCIFKCANEKWIKPSQVFLDVPYLDTGLSAYYDAVEYNMPFLVLDKSYENCGVPVEKIAEFAKAVGAQTRLEIKKTKCVDNPEWNYLQSVNGTNITNAAFDKDYTIDYLEKILKKQSLSISKLIWKTMCESDPSCLYAKYQKNAKHGYNRADSQLVHHLKKAEWVPQINGNFVIPSKAARELLPEGFYEIVDAPSWLDAICFGKDIEEKDENILEQLEKQKKKEAAAKVLGFTDPKSLEEAKWFAKLTEKERQQVKTEYQSRHAKLPTNIPSNRRIENVRKEAIKAPKRQIVVADRSTSKGLDEVKTAAKEYLKVQYTNTDNEMICQICEMPMPFKLNDDSYFFERIQFLEMKKLHTQNYLALCPTDAAMFMYANDSRGDLKDKFSEIASNKLEVVLAKEKRTIYFTNTHIIDLKGMIEGDPQDDK